MRLCVAALAALFLTSISVSVATGTSARTSILQTGGMQAISIDMNTAGNSALSLGSRQECAEALPGDALSIDITATQVPADSPMVAYSYRLVFDGPPMAITKQEPLMLLSAADSSILNVSDRPPVFDGSFSANVLDTNVPDSVESGSGVLDRLTLEISTDAAPGTYVLRFEAPAHIDDENNVHSPATINDARVAVGVSCSSSTPIPSRTPDLPDTGTPTPAATTSTPDASPNQTSPTPTPSTPLGSTGTAAPTPDSTATGTPTAAPPTIDRSGSDSMTVIAIAGAVFAGLAAAAAAGWFAYRTVRN